MLNLGMETNVNQVEADKTNKLKPKNNKLLDRLDRLCRKTFLPVNAEFGMETDVNQVKQQKNQQAEAKKQQFPVCSQTAVYRKLSSMSAELYGNRC